MKLLIILIASLLSAEVVVTKYNAVNFRGKSLEHITMETNKKDNTKKLYYLGSFELDEYKLIKCNKKEGLCLVERDPFDKGE